MKSSSRRVGTSTILELLPNFMIPPEARLHLPVTRRSNQDIAAK
jgi:hypothetical protein